VDSRVGAGTAFTLYLPLAKGEHIASATPDVRPVPLRTQRVLLVEDNDTVGEFARELLQELGQIVTWVQNGEAALALLEEAPGKFDLVFTDVVMPGMNGVELAQAIALRWPTLRVVLTSGYSHVLAQEGSHGFTLLRKPYAVEGLLGVLQASGTPTPDETAARP
jgi:CheY-like chemotaxis protein